MKKLLTLLISIILSGSVYAKTKLTVTHNWGGGDTHAPFTEFAFKDFQEKHPDIELEINAIPASQARQLVRKDFLGGVASDIVLWYGGAESYEYIKAGKLYDITKLLAPKKGDFINGALDNMTFSGKHYGLPLAQNFFAFYVDTHIYKKHGLELPRNYKELLSQVKILKKEGYIPIMLPGANHPLIQHFFSFVANQTTKAGVFDKASYQEDGYDYNDPGFLKAAQIIEELAKAGAFDPNVEGTPMTTVEDMMNKGRGAMYFAGIWRVGALSKSIRDRTVPILFPKVEGFTENPNIATSQTEMGWVVNKQIEGDAAKEAALSKFLEYFGKPETSQAFVELTDTIIPIQKGVNVAKATMAVKESVRLVSNAELRPFLRYYQSPAQGQATNKMAWSLILQKDTAESAIKKWAKTRKNRR